MTVRVVISVALLTLAVWLSSMAVLRLVGAQATKRGTSIVWSLLMAAAWCAWYVVYVH